MPVGCIRSIGGENSDGTQILTLSLFDSEAAADSAAALLEGIGLAKHEAIDVLALDDKGQLKVRQGRSAEHGEGRRYWCRVVAPGSGGHRGWALVGGGLLGALHHKGSRPE